MNAYLQERWRLPKVGPTLALTIPLHQILQDMASTIPNLNTLRTIRGETRRGRRGGSASGGEHLDSTELGANAARDGVVQQTDQDASSSRMSAVALGYLEDDFASRLAPVGSLAPKRFPIINRGTYVRTRSLDELVVRFLRTRPEQSKQIVSLGAGSDTRFFRLRQYARQHNYSHVEYHELDFEANINRKRSAVRNDALLVDCIREGEKNGWNLRLHAMDLRDLTKKSPPIISDLRHDLPTLILSECCLCYLPPEEATSVLQYFTMHLDDALSLILYEPIRPFDAFGKVMVSNLASRGIHLQTLKRYATMTAQRQRLRLAGFQDGQGARDILQLYESDEWIGATERDRVERLEWLDEVEEWRLLASHYCVAWGWKGTLFAEAWNGLDGSLLAAEARDLETM